MSSGPVFPAGAQGFPDAATCCRAAGTRLNCPAPERVAQSDVALQRLQLRVREIPRFLRFCVAPLRHLACYLQRMHIDTLTARTDGRKTRKDIDEARPSPGELTLLQHLCLCTKALVLFYVLEHAIESVMTRCRGSGTGGAQLGCTSRRVSSQRRAHGRERSRSG